MKSDIKIDQDNSIHWRFSRRCGEQHADANYANPIEGPTDRERAYRAIDRWLTVASLAAGVALLIIIKVYG